MEMLNSFMHLNPLKIKTIAIGSFDGIHRGHQQLIKKLGKDGAIFIIDKGAANLTPGFKRDDYSKYPCIYYDFYKLKDLSGKEFIRLLLKLFPQLKKIVIGYDFRFGAKRAHGADDLKTLFDGEVEVVKEFCFDGISVHSSTIRELIRDGNITQANRLLGREYAIMGDIVRGQGLGKNSLYPTLNLSVKKYLLPKSGAYATRTLIENQIFKSVSFIGIRESTDGAFSVETHIIDTILSEEPTEAEVFFVEYLRKNRKFKDLKDLKKQITVDIKESNEILLTCKVYFDSKNEGDFKYLS